MMQKIIHYLTVQQNVSNSVQNTAPWDGGERERESSSESNNGPRLFFRVCKKHNVLK